MAQPTKIHSEKTPPRKHFIAEWAERRGLSQADIGRATGADKGTVSRWFDGIIPKEKYLTSIAGAVSAPDITALFRHPDDDWMTRFFQGRDEEERKRIRDTLETAFPRKAG